MGSGTTPAALAFGGLVGSSYKTLTESWNGASWTEQSDMSTSRFDAGDGGSAVSAIVYGGSIPGGKTNATEEWTADNTLADVTVS